MTPEELRFLQQQEDDLSVAQQNSQMNQVGSAHQNFALQQEEKSMIKDQLDLGEELEMIENLLRGRVLKKDKHGNQTYEDPEDPEMIILSEHGIHLIMNTITFYINKNTLLSNYDDDTINTKMEDFATDLSDTIFMEYEKIFQYPTFADTKKVLLERLDRKTELKKFSLELIGHKADGVKIKKALFDELEGKVETELQKIKEQIIKNKLKRFLILLRTVQDAVHSTYLRAWKGQERTTLRQHIHISENRGLNRVPPPASNMNPLSWFKR